MFGMKFEGGKNVPRTVENNGITKVGALEHHSNKEEIIKAKLDNLQLSSKELNDAIEHAGGKEKVEAYLKKYGQEDYSGATEKEEKYKVFAGLGASMAAALMLMNQFAISNEGDAAGYAGIAAFMVGIGSAASYIKSRIEKGKATTTSVLMDTLNVDYKTSEQIKHEEQVSHLEKHGASEAANEIQKEYNKAHFGDPLA